MLPGEKGVSEKFCLACYLTTFQLNFACFLKGQHLAANVLVHIIRTV